MPNRFVILQKGVQRYKQFGHGLKRVKPGFRQYWGWYFTNPEWIDFMV